MNETNAREMNAQIDHRQCDEEKERIARKDCDCKKSIVIVKRG
jgi:hypothetical protein